jgi:hypothetical protein
MNTLGITIMGAAGKMGRRITEKLSQENLRLFLCEKGEKGIQYLLAKGLQPVPQEEAIPQSDLVIMAIPDRNLEEVSREVVPLMKKGGTMLYLDATVPYFGNVMLRDDCTFVAAHPCHPPLFGEEEHPEARRDFFGGIAKQDVVIALIQGEEAKLAMAQDICAKIFAPVRNIHRISLEQMAILEPILAEVVAVPAIYIIKEAIDEAVKRGVPEDAALAFMLGHVRIDLAILLGGADIEFSDACKVALKRGYELLFRPDWKKVFEPEIAKSIALEMMQK